MAEKHVFISYSREDKTTMQRVKKTLIESGLEVWTDEGIDEASINWQIAIEDAIEASACIICILSPDARKSKWVREELMFATFHEKPVYMVHVRGGTKEVAILGFTVAQQIDVRDVNLYEPRMIDLCKSIKAEHIGSITIGRIGQENRLMTYKLTDPDEAAQHRNQAKTGEPKVHGFMPASIPDTEQHQLVVMKGKEYTASTIYQLGRDFISIGRGNDNDVNINNVNVSREHCQLIYTDRGFLVRDTNSTNGTYINAERIRLRHLKHSDKIQIGPEIVLLYRTNRQPTEVDLVISQVDIDAQEANAELPITLALTNNLQETEQIRTIGMQSTDAKPTKKFIFDEEMLLADDDDNSELDDNGIADDQTPDNLSSEI